MEYSPPPLFKQGASARAKVVIFSLIAIALLLADSRLHALVMIRQVVGTMLYPLQMAALMPRDAVHAVGGYFSSVRTLEKENLRLKNQQVANAQTLQQNALLLAENAQLRKLLSASERLPVKSLMTEILYDARDAFTRKIVLDRGSRHGVEPGHPVIDDTGVVGQITRVFPFTAEATLLTDKDQAIPVQVVRSGLRSVAYGRGQSGVLDLRFMAVNADIRKGDLLVTSGIDGVYPAGLAVAKVAEVEHKSADAFARIVCLPAAGIDRNKQLLILLTDTKLPPRPPADEPKDKKAIKKAAAGQKEAAGKDVKEPAKEPVKDAQQPVKEGQTANDAAAAKAAAAPVKDAQAVKAPATAVPPTNRPAVTPTAATGTAGAVNTGTTNTAAEKPVAPVNKPAATAPTAQPPKKPEAPTLPKPAQVPVPKPPAATAPALPKKPEPLPAQKPVQTLSPKPATVETRKDPAKPAEQLP